MKIVKCVFIVLVIFNYSFSQNFQEFNLENSSMSNPMNLCYLNDKLIFFAYTDAYGIEPWCFDNQTQSCYLLKDIAPGNESSVAYYTYSIVYNNKLFFVANDGVHGSELWFTDGTPNGTCLLYDINENEFNSEPDNFYIFNNILYFTADNNLYGRELWKTDGTSVGTKLVKDINPGANGSYPSMFVECNNKLFFSALHDSHGYELWITDGTENNTYMLKDLTNNIDDGYPYHSFNPICLNNLLIFVGYTNTTGSELFVSDGTSSGTNLLKDIYPGPSSSSICYPVKLNNFVIFSADNSINGQELWKTDGTTNGTVLLKDIFPGFQGSYPSDLYLADSIVLFSAEDSDDNIELWKTNGYQVTLLKNISNYGSSYPENFFKYANKVFFTADHDQYGNEIFVTNGTSSGTQLLKNINTNPFIGSYAHSFTIYNDKLYFIADIGTLNNNEDYQLFESDGTSSGTHMISPNNSQNPFNSIYYPFYLTSTPFGLFFKSAFNQNNGLELWRYYYLTNNKLTYYPKDFYCTYSETEDCFYCYSKNKTAIKIFTFDGKLVGETFFNEGFNELPYNDEKPFIIYNGYNSLKISKKAY